MHWLTKTPLHVRAFALYLAHSFVFMTLTIGGMSVALPEIMKDFDVPVTTAVWVIIGYQIALPGSMMAVGAITRHFEGRKQVVLGFALDALMMTISFLTGNIYVFILTRFLSCIARCPPWVILQVMGIGGYPPEQRGKAVGYNSFFSGLSFLAALPLTGLFVDYLGWRYLFLTAAIIYVLMIPLIYLMIPKLPPRTERPKLSDLDLQGSVLMMSGMVCFITAVQLFARGLGGGASAITLGIVGVTSLALFVWAELRAKSPILDLRLFRIPDVSVAASQALFLGFSNGLILLVLPFMFISGFGWTAAYVSGILVFQNIPRPPAGPLAGRLADRFGSTRVILPATAISVVGQLAMAFFGASPPLQIVVAALLFWGTGQAIMQTANLRQIYAALPQERLHVAPTLILVSNSLGAVIGQGLASLAIERARDGSDTSAGFVNMVGESLVLFTAVFAAGTVLSLLLPKTVERLWPASRPEPVPVGAAAEAAMPGRTNT